MATSRSGRLRKASKRKMRRMGLKKRKRMTWMRVLTRRITSMTPCPMMQALNIPLQPHSISSVPSTTLSLNNKLSKLPIIILWLCNPLSNNSSSKQIQIERHTPKPLTMPLNNSLIRSNNSNTMLHSTAKELGTPRKWYRPSLWTIPRF
jgi:hypothetical protein